MNKIVFLSAVTCAIAGISFAAYAKDTGFSSTFAANTTNSAGLATLSPAAGTPADTKATPQKKKTHKKHNDAKSGAQSQPAPKN